SEIIRLTIERTLGKPVEDVFETFSDEPIGTGSVGQVHRATLKDGRRVAVKVKHPNIRQAMESDISILNLIKPMLRRQMPLSDVGEVIEELSFHLLLETDYQNELANQKLFYEGFKSDSEIVIPQPIEELCND